MKNHQLCNCLGNKKLTELWHILFYIFPFYKTSGVQILIILVMIKNVEISVALESQEVFLFSPKSRSMQNEKKHRARNRHDSNSCDIAKNCVGK
jgi:hypothetical protein